MTLLTITINSPVTKILLPTSMILNSSGLELLVLEGDMFPSGDVRKNPLVRSS